MIMTAVTKHIILLLASCLFSVTGKLGGGLGRGFNQQCCELAWLVDTGRLIH